MNSCFSIVVPVYNVEPYLRMCLDSVLGQTFSDWEMICVNDGSSDGSGGILDEYVSKDSRIRVIHQKNAGQGAARNKGLDCAAGRYVLFLDADDSLIPNCLAYLNDVLKQTDADVVRYGLAWTHATNELVPFEDLGFQVYDVRSIPELRSMVRFIGGMYGGNCCYRREAIGEIRFKCITPGEDVLFGTEVVQRIRRFVQTTTKLYRYFQRTGSTMKHRIDAGFVRRAIVVTRMRNDAMLRWKSYPLVKDVQFRAMMDCFAGGLSNGLSRLCGDDRSAITRVFFDEGRKIFTDGFSSLIFRSQSWLLFMVCYRLEWKLRVALLRWGLVRTFKNLVRGA